MRSEESLLSTNSCVIEESASSGGESSPSSGVVYKNIIINLKGSGPNSIAHDSGPPSRRDSGGDIFHEGSRFRERIH